MKVLLTGGAGYIGSMTCIGLIEAGASPVLLDNFCNSKPEVLARVRKVTGVLPDCVRADVRDTAAVRAALRDHGIEAVVHFAGLKAVGDSVREPLDYYANNVGGTMSLLEAMQHEGVTRLVFSSSATVYAETTRLPIAEDAPLDPISPYGRTKLHIEDLLRDFAPARPHWSITLLRYFNPVGAHPSGELGEDPQGVPNNLMPYVAQVAVGRRERLQVYGRDYPTPDGTGMRDYLHVMDLAQGHIAALRARGATPGLHTYNLGRGCGQSVLEVVSAFERASGRTIPVEFAPRRAGDLAAYWADPARAERELAWKAMRGLDEICADTWRWQSRNPSGYA